MSDLNQVMALGFSESAARSALSEANGDVHAAIELCLNGGDASADPSAGGASTHVIKEGILQKQSFMGIWGERWVSVVNTRDEIKLRYYAGQQNKDSGEGPREEIALEHATVTITSPSYLQFEVKPKAGRTVFAFRAKSQSEMDNWIDALQAAVQEAAITPSELTEFFAMHNPSKLDEVDTILLAYTGEHDKLRAHLREKYSAVPSKQLGQPPKPSRAKPQSALSKPESSSSTSSSSAKKDDVRESKDKNRWVEEMTTKLGIDVGAATTAAMEKDTFYEAMLAASSAGREEQSSACSLSTWNEAFRAGRQYL